MSTAPEFIPYGSQWIDNADAEAIARAIRDPYLTTGPAVARLEAALAAHAHTQHAVVLNSGTSALHAAYHAAGLTAQDNIITTPLTFAGTANAARFIGAEVRFVDIRADTGNLDPGLVEAAVDPRTRLLCPVDYAGHPADYETLAPLAKDLGLRLIADACHSFGGRYHRRAVGSLADASVLSMHPVKAITTAEGGAIFTDDATLAERARDFRNHGIVRDRARMSADHGPWYYEMQSLGYNYRLSDLQCALGLSQAQKLPAFIARRQQIAARYLSALADLPALRLPTVRPGCEPGWHLFVVRLTGDPSRRRAFFERLRALRLGVQVHYIPVHTLPYYRDLGYQPGLCPVAEDFYARCVSLPIFPKMSDSQVDAVIGRVHQAAGELL